MLIWLLPHPNTPHYFIHAPQTSTKTHIDGGNRYRRCIPENPRKVANRINMNSDHGEAYLPLSKPDIQQHVSAGRVYSY